LSEAGISFTKDRVQDKTTEIIHTDQIPMFTLDLEDQQEGVDESIPGKVYEPLRQDGEK